MDRTLVRPRFSDGTFEEPLPLEEHFAERFLGSASPGSPSLGPPSLVPPALLIEGPRGSGLTTTLGILAAAASAAGRTPILARDLLGEDGAAVLRELAKPGAILLADLSVLPSDGGDRELLRALGPAFLRSRALVVAGSDLRAFLRWSGLPASARVTLAPWGRDELIELLGTAPYKEYRARIHAGLARLEGSHSLLANAATARSLVEAACRLEEGEPFTRSRLFAGLLDELSPETIALARTTSAAWSAELLRSGAPLAEALRLFKVAPRSARILLAGRTPFRDQPAGLALDGLHDFLRAGALVKKVADDEVPSLDVKALPFVAEMTTPALEERLVSWLVAPEARPRAGSFAATVLHALGRKLPLEHLGGRDLAGALLAGADLKGAKLRGARLSRADLTGARLDRAVLQLGILEDVSAVGASFDGAWLFAVKLGSALLDGASFRGATLVKANATNASFQGACFAGAILGGAHFSQSCLDRADFTDASFRGTLIASVRLDEADFTGADMKEARLQHLDLARARFAPASLVEANLESCSLVELDLSDLQGGQAIFMECDLSATSFKGAQLAGARFGECRGHDVVFDGADLRGAVFGRCNFHAGSSRSGLLLGKPALEGNMTGFYVEGTTDDSWASPDSIRQASFRGADLRGAVFQETDLFRVDFRGAQLGVGLRDHAVRAGAIVD